MTLLITGRATVHYSLPRGLAVTVLFITYYPSRYFQLFITYYPTQKKLDEVGIDAAMG